MEQYNHRIGKIGENIAWSYFKKLGYVLIAKNARISHKEIDLIVSKGQDIRFIEVKTSYIGCGNSQNNPKDYVSKQKIANLKQALDEYCLILAKKQENVYIDLIAISLSSNNMANISYIKNIT